jgi:hypothetical protein
LQYGVGVGDYIARRGGGLLCLQARRTTKAHVGRKSERQSERQSEESRFCDIPSCIPHPWKSRKRRLQFFTKKNEEYTIPTQ